MGEEVTLDDLALASEACAARVSALCDDIAALLRSLPPPRILARQVARRRALRPWRRRRW